MKPTLFILQCLFVIVICSFAHAETDLVPVNRFLETAFQDERLRLQNETVSFLKHSSSNTPLVRAVEFRTKFDRFESNRQQYAIRLTPNGLGEDKDAETVYDQTLRYNEALKPLLLNQALKDRYGIVIAYLHNRQMLFLNEKLTVLYEDRIGVLKKQSANDPTFDPDNLINGKRLGRSAAGFYPLNQ